jgi:ribonucleoside-diphosphate reductase alpha chain
MNDLVVVKRDGSAVPFKISAIFNAVRGAANNVLGDATANSVAVHEMISGIVASVVSAVTRGGNASATVEDIQDQVELALMRAEQHKIARSYILYREKRTQEREAVKAAALAALAKPVIHVVKDGVSSPLDEASLLAEVKEACRGYESVANAEDIAKEITKAIYDGVKHEELSKAKLLGTRPFMERDPAYSFITARLLLNQIKEEVVVYDLATAILIGIHDKRIDPRLAQFDLPRLQDALKFERDDQFGFLALQTLYDRYFLHKDDVRYELPQTFFMRVSMGLALNETDKNERAIEFYNLLSSFDFMSSTPTLFNSGTVHSQLSSCYLTTVDDDLAGIYDSLKDNAMLSKFAGGLGNSWTSVRALGARIKGTNGKSQGVVPFLKVVNDTAVAVNQGGKRKGAVCTYLETWHLDIEEFLELRKNTGDDRRRTHDMNTANWIPDLFMKRVMENGDWTLFSPNDVTDLHEKFGADFEDAYIGYEKQADLGDLKLFKRIPAVQLWRKMLTMVFETGHPWVTFKDPCNIRSPQQHTGVVHSSNLCTEITLNTSKDEIAVCNLGSVNLVRHLKNGELDLAKLEKTVTTAMRMLDNVIDINFYPVDKARRSNERHRPVGMGIMGFQDCLYEMSVPYSSDAAVSFADKSMEAVAYYAYLASSKLAAERGSYPSYSGSLWSQGILPQDTIQALANSRKGYLQMTTEPTERLDWEIVRKSIDINGMRNSNCLAIAPTATISNIIGVSQSIEPTYQNLYVKSNLSGEFTEINEHLVAALKKLNLWDETMIADLKYFDGSLLKIERIPAQVKELYATAFEVETKWLIEAASSRQIWIDQAQSLNLYMAQPSGKKLDEMYKLAWLRGLKTTYYLRSLGATSAEKSTSRAGALNAVQSAPVHVPEPEVMGRACAIDAGPECESCQ